MDLKSGTFPWIGTLEPKYTYPTLDEDLKCDTVIIGGGMSGAILAYELSKQGQQVVLLEKHAIGTGSSSANTGLLQFCNDKSISSCIHTFGEKHGIRFYQLCKEAIDKLIALKDELLFDTQLILRSSLYYASCEDHVKLLKQDYDILVRNGFPVEWWNAEDVERSFGFKKPAAIVSHGDAEVNAFRFIHALLLTAVKRYGLRVYEHSKVNRRTNTADSIVVTTDGRHHVTAQHAIFAMGYETQELKRDRNAKLESTFAIMSEPIEGLDQVWHERMLIWETARPYLYMRTTPDHRIVAGGLDESTMNPAERDRMLPQKAKLLEQEVMKLFPSLAPIRFSHAWSAVFCSTHDGYPYIGAHPDYPRCYFIEPYGGNGTVYCMIAAEIIPALVTQGNHPDADLFRLDRSPHPSPFSE
ncbi:NAD(P)/FAD-dependent oxidoreductase [Paenibacillus marinisediminis]